MIKNAMFAILIVLSTFLYGQGVKLEVEGFIQIANSEASTAEEGTLRWSGYAFQGWTGNNWENLSFGFVADVERNVYKTLKLGMQEWMTENLRTSKYKNGDDINYIGDDNSAWSSTFDGAWSWYGNINTNELPYGMLYNWYAVDDARGLCPTGWHVPNEADMMTLVDYLGGVGVAGAKLKETGAIHWISPNTGASNESGFTGLPGGLRGVGGPFDDLGTSMSIWRSSEISTTHASFLGLYNGLNGVLLGSSVDKNYGFSVRCLKD